MPKQHDFTDTAKDMIGRTVGRIKREVGFLDMLINTYPDAASKPAWEFYKKCEAILEKDE